MDDEAIEQMEEVFQQDGVTAEANPPCVALVPVTETARWSSPIRTYPGPIRFSSRI